MSDAGYIVCRNCGRRSDAHDEAHCKSVHLGGIPRPAPKPDPMAAPHVDVSSPLHGGSIRLRSASGGLESLWVHLRDESGAEVAYDKATGQWLSAPVRITPKQARALSDLLRRYADTHRETPDE